VPAWRLIEIVQGYTASVSRSGLRGLAVLLVAAGLAAGCGAQPGQDAVTRAADQWLAAARAKDAAALCRLLTPAAAESAATGDESCRQAVSDLNLPGDGPVDAVQVWSDQAQVRAAGDTLFLTRLSDGWRVNAAGCQEQGDQPYDCDVEG
jgi:ketosteroid isomerase-like protein